MHCHLFLKFRETTLWFGLREELEKSIQMLHYQDGYNKLILNSLNLSVPHAACVLKLFYNNDKLPNAADRSAIMRGGANKVEIIKTK